MTHTVVVDLGFGDAGKGATVDYLCATRDVKAVIRYNGGPQCAHNVIQPDGRHHTFSLFGSGTYHDVPTHLSEYVLVNPYNLMHEADALVAKGLPDPRWTLTVSRDALLTTPYHMIANRMMEDLRGNDRHGSCGQGVGLTTEYALWCQDYNKIRVQDMYFPGGLRRKLEYLRYWLEDKLGAKLEDVETPDEMAESMHNISNRIRIVNSDYVDQLLDSGSCVFEGAQGVLLDEDYGFHPHTTWTATTSKNARTLLAGRDAHVLGVTRSYMTRHGAGPFPSESNHTMHVDEPFNITEAYQGVFRQGMLDLVLLQYACDIEARLGGIDSIAVTHLDTRDQQDRGVVIGYKQFDGAVLHKLPLPSSLKDQENLTELLFNVKPRIDVTDTEEDLIDYIEEWLNLGVSLTSYGATHSDRRERMMVR